MKKLLTACILLLIVGCKRQQESNVINYKSYTNYWGYPMPNKICRFAKKGSEIIFQDSCHLYHIGDTIK